MVLFWGRKKVKFIQILKNFYIINLLKVLGKQNFIIHLIKIKIKKKNSLNFF